MAERDASTDVAIFLAGAAFGAGVALLLAPQSGRKTRRLIQKKGQDTLDYVAGKGHDIYDRGKELADDATRFAERTIKSVM